MTENQVEQVQAIAQAFKNGVVAAIPGDVAADAGGHADGDLGMTLEALLPQYRQMCQVFYRHHDAGALPVAAQRWIHRELMARFGVVKVLEESRAIARRLQVARRGVRAALGVRQ